ncbi:unnamed protein product [Cylindrotheca closterium]|uniref:Uncharacterized protein n=1 Tax=Cylindrotheca closterium TaxID=2856 RepID=A0AAD2G057_9STRA|nr:unnamed protein product [Cylindrotheca closterium]
MTRARSQKRRLLQGADCKDETYPALPNKDKSNEGEVGATGSGRGTAFEANTACDGRSTDSNGESKLDGGDGAGLSTLPSADTTVLREYVTKLAYNLHPSIYYINSTLRLICHCNTKP